MSFDRIDTKILNILQQDGRITNVRLAKEIGISPPAMLERVRRLNASGVIDRYAAILEREKAGFGLLAIVVVSLSLHQIPSLQQIKEQLIELEEVQECLLLTGDWDFLLKVAIKDMRTYTDFINDSLSGIPGIQNIRTSFVLDTLKSETMLPIRTTPERAGLRGPKKSDHL
ncbi:Lrp/AsnC family transcriptional regulator [Desulfogranum mediterraneum]|uniref:Lrp/AsnC family transcriptional regulator n=1 Tax=Desulfogranum mediterraneum TaxID=160661 RepID=UPI00041BFC13|nr:Lrp/AsnC family transcriptional regulator [Desulfogranum mediterraneum]